MRHIYRFWLAGIFSYVVGFCTETPTRESAAAAECSFLALKQHQP